MRAREAPNEPRRLVGGSGGDLGAREATSESSYSSYSLGVVEGSWKPASDGTRWWWWWWW
jgi:hypothetical protein